LQIARWTFIFGVPFAKLKDTLSALARVQQAVSRNRGMNLSYSVLTSQVSPELQNSQQCAFPALVSAAQRQAQAMAGVAGVRVGPIVALSQGSSGVLAAAAIPAYRGDYQFISGTGAVGLSSFLLAAPTTTTCSLTVQFKLLR
jgi:uncharacterized protein YggE